MKKILEILKTPFKGYKKLKKPVKTAICLVLVAAILTGGYFTWDHFKTKEASTDKSAGTSIVRRGTLTNSITGSGTVEPIEQREIVPEVNGKILEAPVAEGATVKAGDILYRFEMTAATNAIKTAENNVEKAQTTLSNRQHNIEKVQENIKKLTIYAPSDGKVDGISMLVGEEASGKVCTLTNTKEQTVTIPFSSAQIGNIKVNDSADVAIDKYMINTKGTVVRKYTAPETLDSGAVIYNVEIRLSSDSSVEENVNVTATVHTKSGDIGSASYGSVKYASPVTVNAEQRGRVKKVNFKNGDWVKKGDVIAVLENSDLADELKTAQQNYKEAQMNLTEARNNLEDKQEAAQDYIVTSPIDGVVLTKDYFVGDTITGQNPPAMMVVADMSKMKFTISADELDIAKIQLGQSVSVTADALERQRLTGTITTVSKLGTASNGVTNYPIEVTIDNPGDLMPGMNVNAQIIVEQRVNSLYLPTQAVEYYEGKYYVTIVGEVENMPEPVVREGFGSGNGSGSGNGFGNGFRNGNGFGSFNRNSDGNEGGDQNRQRPSGNWQRDGQTMGRPSEKAPSESKSDETKTAPTQTSPAQASEGEKPSAQSSTPAEGENKAPSENANSSSENTPQRSQGERPSGNWQRGSGQMPSGNWQRGQSTAPANISLGFGQTVFAAEEPAKADDSKTKAKSNTKSNTKTDAKSSSAEKGNQEKSNGKGNDKTQKGGFGEKKQEELKIKYYEKEKRVEVKIGITTDTSYEILEGVSYGQVVKNTTQTTASATGNNAMRQGMGGFGGGMGGFGGMSGGMSGGMRSGMSGGNFGGGNRQSNRSSNMGGRR